MWAIWGCKGVWGIAPAAGYGNFGDFKAKYCNFTALFESFKSKKGLLFHVFKKKHNINARGKVVKSEIEGKEEVRRITRLPKIERK